jgi:hypothetical protein
MAKAGFVGKLVFMQDYNQDNHLHWQEMNEPQTDCKIGLGPAYFPKAGEMYRDLLCRLRVSDNMAFIGKKEA